MEFFENLLRTQSFMPHGHCYLWRTDILWLNVGSDLLIGFAYFMIPFFLIRLVRQRKDLSFNWIFILFALFITACGLTHLVEIITVWQPIYGVQGLTKSLTALVSVATAISLYFLMPKALLFPSINQLKDAEQRYRTILNSAMDAFIAVDGQGRITYCNQQLLTLFGWESGELMGTRFVEKFMPPSARTPGRSDLEILQALAEKKIAMSLLLKNGRDIPTDINTSLVQSDKERFFGIFIHNTSERIQAERLQRTQLEVTKALVESESIGQAFSRFIHITCRDMGWEFGAVWMGSSAQPKGLRLQEIWQSDGAAQQVFTRLYQHREEPFSAHILTPEPMEHPIVRTKALVDADYASHIQLRVDIGPDHVGLIEFLTNQVQASDRSTREVLQDLGNRLALCVKRQQAENQTRLSEERYRELVDSVKDYGIFLIDANGLILSWNRGAEQLTGYKAHEVLGRHVSIFYPAEANERDAATHDFEVARSVGKFEDEGWRLRKDHSRFFANVIITPVYDGQDRVQGYSTITRDITGRKLAEEKQQLLQQELKRQVREQTEELRHSANQIRTITDALPDAIIYFDRDQNVIFANETFLSWQNRRAAEVQGRSVAELLGPAVQQQMIMQFARKIPDSKLSFEHEFLLQNRKRLCHVTCIPDLGESNGELRGVIAVIADITDQRSVEENLRVAKEAADTANAAKSAFLANMSHEIRTPLGAILGYSELLISQGLSSTERLNYLGALKRNGDLLGNIISDVLDLSKVEAGKLEFEKQEVPIQEILSDLTTLLHLQAVEKGISLIVSAEGPIPSSIETDSLRLRQILMNIVGNALKFTNKGSIEVKVKSITAADNRMLLAFVVRDTGPGITAEQATKLFRPFSQADVSTTRKFGGTGLGLTLSKKLAEGLGGDLILAESRVGEGSTFMITIDPGQNSRVLFQSSQGSLQRQAPSLSVAFETRIDGMNVLLVEDSVDNQIVVQRFLKIAGCSADLADNGLEALEKVKAKDYDVILMDIQMPVMDGFEATAALRKMGYQQPIIALTAHALKEQRQQCLERGFTNHITKPVNRDALITMIAQYGRKLERRG